MFEFHVIFWVAVFLLVYTYAGYPLLIRALAALRPLPHTKAALEPGVSILVIVHNEEERIEAKLGNLLAQDYPAERMEIVVASDASTDATVDRARAYLEHGVRIIEFAQHRGKPAVLNNVIPRLHHEFVVLMDVRQRLESHCLRALMANFADPTVGAVSGELMLEEGAQGSDVGEGVGFYWRYEKFIRQQEARLDSTVGATGALYAIQRRLFKGIAEETILDDVLIPMQVVRQGYRVLFEPEARAFDVIASAEGEFRRKVRTIAGNFQLLFREPWLLNPFCNRLWLQTLSHKFCRLLGPLCLAAVLVSNLMLLEFLFYRVTLLLQVLFYGIAIAGYLMRNPAKRPAIVNVPYTFCLLNWATVMGLIRLLLGRQRVTWQKVRN